MEASEDLTPKRRHDENLRTEVANLREATEQLAQQVITLTSSLNMNYARKGQLDEVGIAAHMLIKAEVDNRAQELREEFRSLILGSFVLQAAIVILLVVLILTR